MGNTATPTLLGGSVSPALAAGKGKVNLVWMSFPMSNSYATGGDTWTGPTSDVRGQEFRGLIVLGSSDNTRNYFWNGSLATPKIQAESRAGVEVTAATDLSANTVYAIGVYES